MPKLLIYYVARKLLYIFIDNNMNEQIANEYIHS